MRILKKYPYTLLLALAIWVVCLIPIPDIPVKEISFIDKWTHFLMYGTLTLVMLRERHAFSWTVLLLPVIQGVLIELAQAYLTTCRSGDWFDALCNTLGVLLGAVIYRGVVRIRE